MPEAAMDKTPHYKLEGKFANTPTTLWLEKATHLIRRIDQDTGLNKATPLYKPQAYIEIPANELEFDEPEKGESLFSVFDQLRIRSPF